jgi:hypothetical protein
LRQFDQSIRHNGEAAAGEPLIVWWPPEELRRAVSCSGLLSATVEDATAQKQVDFKVEKRRMGMYPFSVSAFQFKAEPTD